MADAGQSPAQIFHTTWEVVRDLGLAEVASSMVREGRRGGGVRRGGEARMGPRFGRTYMIWTKGVVQVY